MTLASQNYVSSAGKTLDGQWQRATKRVVHRFDFDERDEGNLEDVPKFWEAFRPPGFPHYARGGFDFDVGHDAAPSFHLASEGRNVSFQYVGPDTRVRQNSEYRIEAWIKPDRLRHARACLGAHFIDRFGNVLSDTVVRSRYVGGGTDAWEEVSIHLRAAPPDAFAVGLTAWVVQPSIWDQSIRPAHYIPHRDVFGSAWFDDLTVYRLPRVVLESSDAANVLEDGAPQELWVTLADHDDRSLVGTLSIKDAEGALVETHTFPVVLESDAAPNKVAVGHLEPGLYRAELVIGAQGETFMTRTLDFARVAPLLRGSDALARSFGVSIDPAMRTDPETEGSLLLRQQIHAVKFPVWTGRIEQPPMAADQRRLDRMYQKLIQSHFTVTAVLHGAPGLVVQSAGAYAPLLLDLLSTDPDSWEQHLAVVAAPYAGTFRSWQIGADGDATVLTFERLGDVLHNVRAALRPFMTDPQIAAPGDAGVTRPTADSNVDQLTVTLGSALPADSFATVIRDWRVPGLDGLSVRVDPLDEAAYARLPRLADWMRRVILARHGGARTVYVPQTWRVRETIAGQVAEPRDTYLLLRTMADIVGDREPGPELPIENGVRCVSFRDAERSVLALWTEESGEVPVRVPIQLGQASRQIDAWGRTTPLAKNDLGLHVVTLTDMPVFVDNVENWLVDLVTSLTLQVAHVESGAETVPITIEWAYRGTRGIAGHVEFVVPESWAVEPRGLDARLSPNRIERMNAVLRLPPTENGGHKEFYAHVRLSEPSYDLVIPLSFELSIKDIDVWGMAYVDGDQLVMRHAITNNARESVSFRSAANVPGRERQYRPFTDLKPGDTQTAVYRFENGRELIGRRVSMVLRELNDGRRTHTLEFLVP